MLKSQSFANLIAFLSLCLVTISSTSCAQSRDSFPVPSADAASEITVGLGAESRFGVDYVFPLDDRYQRNEIASTLSATGVGWVNFALVGWNKIEPRPPRGDKHDYRWAKLDRAVRHWQDAGFEIVITLRMGKGWFSGPHRFSPTGLNAIMKAMMNNADRLPKDEAVDDYKAWVAAIVERYDGDGIDDMPGLIRPVLHYQIGNECGNPAFWTGTLDDYFELLDMAAEAARGASPDVQIIPAGLRPNDIFLNNGEGDNPEPFIEDYLSRLSPEFRNGILRNIELDQRIATNAGTYDIIDAAGNGSWYRPTRGFYRWLDRQMRASGNEAAIWDLESRTEPILIAVDTTHAFLELEVPGGREVLQAMKDKSHPKNRAATEWYRAEQARLLTKVYVTRFAAGAEKVFVGMPMDWDKGLEAIAWPNPYMGLLSSSGDPWPATHTLAFLIEELDGFQRAERIETSNDAWLYRFTFEDERKPVWVVWLHEPTPRGMGKTEPVETVTLEMVPDFSAILRIPTIGSQPVEVDIPTSAPLRLEITPTPLVIRE